MDRAARAASGRSTRREREPGERRRPVSGHYDRAVDRESAYERLKERATGPRPETKAPPQSSEQGSLASDILFGRRGPRGGRQSQGLIEAMAKSAARTVGTQTGRALMRGLLGSLLRAADVDRIAAHG